MSINDYDYVAFLGNGIRGSAHLVRKDNFIYVVKIQKILESEKSQARSHLASHWVEIATLETLQKKLNNVARKHVPDVFDHKVGLCDYIHSVGTASILDPELARELKRLEKSPLCLTYALEYKGHMFDMDMLKLNEKRECMAQVIYTLGQLHKIDISHNDLHFGNIVVAKSESVIIYDGIHRTSPVCYSIIDFGRSDAPTLHKKGSSMYKLAQDKIASSVDLMFLGIKLLVNNYTLETGFTLCKKLSKDTAIWNAVGEKLGMKALIFDYDVMINNMKAKPTQHTYYDIVLCMKCFLIAYGLGKRISVLVEQSNMKLIPALPKEDYLEIALRSDELGYNSLVSYFVKKIE